MENDPSVYRRQDPENRFEDGGFARAIRAEQAGKAPALEVEINVRQNNMAAITDRHVLQT